MQRSTTRRSSHLGSRPAQRCRRGVVHGDEAEDDAAAEGINRHVIFRR